MLVAVDLHEVVRGAVTFVSDPESRWLEWTEPGELQFRLLAVDVSRARTASAPRWCAAASSAPATARY